MSELQIDSISDPTYSTREAAGNSESSHTALVDRMRDHLEKEAETLVQTLQRRVFDPFYTVFEAASAAHSEAVQNLNLESEETALTVDSICEYRQVVFEKVMNPIHTALKSSFTESLINRYREYFSRAREGQDWGPALQVIPEPGALLAPKIDDPPSIRLRKFTIRQRRGFYQARHSLGNGLKRVFRREQTPPITYNQTVPVASLLSYHFEVRLPALVLTQFDDLHVSFAQNVARYEKAQNDWVYAVLDLEQKLAGPSYALPELAPWIIDDAEKTLSTDASLNQRLAVHAEALQNALTLESPAPDQLREALDETIEKACDALTNDLLEGGTFLLSMSEREIPPASSLPLNTRYTQTVQWAGWYREVNNRLRVSALLNEWRDLIVDGRGRLLKSIAAASLTPIFQSLNQLKKTLEAVLEETTALFEHHRVATATEELLQTLRPLHKRASSQFKYILNDLTGLLKAGQALEEPGSTLWRHIMTQIEALPEVLPVHEPMPEPPFSGSASHLRFDINLKEVIAGALLHPLPPQLAQPARSLQKSVVHTWEEIQQVEHMVDYNITAAFSELATPEPSAESPAEAPVEDKTEEHDPIEAAQELIETGLTRSSEKLSELATGLNKPWKQFVDIAFKSLQKYSNDIYGNVSSEDNVHDWWTNVRIRTSRRAQRARRELTRRSDRLQVRLNKLIRRGQRQTKQLIKKGQSAVGVVGQSEDQWLQMLQLMSDIDTLHKRLPLVYRRLFSLSPLEELDLLEGRKLDIAFVKKHFERWQKSQTGPLILAMPYGSGRKSLFNVLSQSVFQEAEVRLISLDRRIQHVDEWAVKVASALEIPFDGRLSLAELERELMAHTRTEKPRVVIVDRLEHLLLCTPGGEKLIERVLIFLSRTDNAVYWVANIGRHAWHFLEKTLRPSSGFISAYRVTQLQRQAIEDIILKRHHRSGMALRYRETSASNSFFDFTRQKDEASSQKAIQTTFFDRLYRLSGQNVLLALVYWLHSVEFDKESDTLLVNALEPINFGFLETLDLNRAFTLKSFLIHRTLTLEEHVHVFRTTASESTIILESLLNLGIIEPASKADNTDRHFRIKPDLPYRIHPLIVHPVTEFLKKLHIIY